MTTSKLGSRKKKKTDERPHERGGGAIIQVGEISAKQGFLEKEMGGSNGAQRTKIKAVRLRRNSSGKKKT